MDTTANAEGFVLPPNARAYAPATIPKEWWAWLGGVFDNAASVGIVRGSYPRLIFPARTKAVAQRIEILLATTAQPTAGSYWQVFVTGGRVLEILDSVGSYVFVRELEVKLLRDFFDLRADPDRLDEIENELRLRSGRHSRGRRSVDEVRWYYNRYTSLIEPPTEDILLPYLAGVVDSMPPQSSDAQHIIYPARVWLAQLTNGVDVDVDIEPKDFNPTLTITDAIKQFSVTADSALEDAS